MYPSKGKRMPPIARAASVLHTSVLTLATHQPIQLVDITRRIAAVVREARLGHGLVQVFRGTPPRPCVFRRTSRCCSRTCAAS